MKTVVFADVHEQVKRVRSILEREADYTKAVFTGDYFDDKAGVPAGCKATIELVLQLIEDTRNVLLIGNHDAHYLFPNNAMIACSNRNWDYVGAIGSYSHIFKKHLKFFHYDTDLKILFTHAGVSDRLYGTKFSTLSALEQTRFLQAECDDAAEQLIKRNTNPDITACGRERGGFGTGGIIWGDLSVHHPVPDLKQIFGHTQVREPVAMTLDRKVHPLISSVNFVTPKTYSIGNDTGLSTYLSIENGIASIKNSDTGEVRSTFSI